MTDRRIPDPGERIRVEATAPDGRKWWRWAEFLRTEWRGNRFGIVADVDSKAQWFSPEQYKFAEDDITACAERPAIASEGWCYSTTNLHAGMHAKRRGCVRWHAGPLRVVPEVAPVLGYCNSAFRGHSELHARRHTCDGWHKSEMAAHDHRDDADEQEQSQAWLHGLAEPRPEVAPLPEVDGGLSEEERAAVEAARMELRRDFLGYGDSVGRQSAAFSHGAVSNKTCCLAILRALADLREQRMCGRDEVGESWRRLAKILAGEIT